MLAIIWATKYYRPYLYGQKFKIVTDHKPLMWLMSFKEPNSKLVRWKLQLLEYDFEVIYKKGSQNIFADALSRVQIEVNCNGNVLVIASAGDTIQSSFEELDENLFISEKPLNEYNIQLILNLNKIRRIIYEPDFTDDTVNRLLKNYLRPNKTCAIFAPDPINKKNQKIVL